MIWVIAGTLDGRTLATRIQEVIGQTVLVSVVSTYGAQLAKHPGIEVHTGRLAQADMEALIQAKGIDLLIDASHPYAAIVTETAQAAAKACRIPCLRYEREEVALPNYDKLHLVSDEEEAASLAASLGQRIFLTTGSKTMPVFAKSEDLQDKDVWTRVLPTAEVLAMLEDLHISAKKIVAIQGPFSYDMNKAMFKDVGAQVVVMKNSGLVGGADTKLQAAMDLGLHIVVIDRPRISIEGPMVHSLESGLQWVKEHYK